jgi:hypothetical protein
MNGSTVLLRHTKGGAKDEWCVGEGLQKRMYRQLQKTSFKVPDGGID